MDSLAPSVSRRLHFRIYLLVLGVVFPLALYFFVEQAGARSQHSLITLTLGGLVTGYAAVQLARLSWDCPRGMLRIVFFIFIYIWAGLAPLYQLGVGVLPWRSSLDIDIYEKTYYLIVFAILCFDLGYAIHFQPHNNSAPRAISSRSIIFFSLAAIMMAVFFGPMTTPLEVLLSYREELADHLGEGPERLVQISLMRIPIYVAALAVVWKLRTTSGDRGGLWIVLALIIPTFLIVSFPTAVSRAWLGAVLISFLVVIMLTSKRRVWSYVPLTICFVFFTVFPILHRFRRADYRVGDSLWEDMVESYSRGDFDVFAMTAHFINYSQTSMESITWGKQLLGALFFYVPRTLWPDKPVGSGYYIAEHFRFPFLNVSAPFWAEGLINFGIAGTALFMFSLGIALKRLDLSAAHSGSVTSAGIIFAFISGFLVLALRGDLFTVMTILLPFLLSVAALRVLR